MKSVALGYGALMAAACFSASAEPAPAPGYAVVGESVTGASQLNPDNQRSSAKSKLFFDSSDPKLDAAFAWAKTQALAFVFEDDPVGPWYEAAEPGREAFCMRDTAHQALGAHALGLDRENLNMLRKFASGISDSKDWCSYWEINRFNQPAPVDYKNDAQFWYNLPANFDVLDCCFRMYVWTGDRAYVDDPAFRNFYDRTVSDYVERWGLDLEHVMTRPRLLNARGIFDPDKKFPKARGIPGYDEGEGTYRVGFDVLSSEYAAFVDYAHFQELEGNATAAQAYQKKAADWKQFLLKTWWDGKNNRFYTRLNADRTLESSGRRSAASLDWGTVPYSDPDQALARIEDLSHVRLEYPEVSFTKIGDIVGGTMGVSLEFTSPLQASVQGYWVETQVKTLSGLGTRVAWAEVRNLPIRYNRVAIRHDGNAKTTFTNSSGPSLIWLAAFAGAHPTLLVNGRPMEARADTDAQNRPISLVRVAVGAGGTVSVELPP